eukprot:COSAG01_NODE_62721_length_283_cov_0.836957_1_plen_71_part_01
MMTMAPLLLLMLAAPTLSSQRAVTLEVPQRVGFRTPEASDRYRNGSNRGTRHRVTGGLLASVMTELPRLLR